MKISDHDLERLGNYFVSHNIAERFEITFILFVQMWKRGQVNV